MAGRRGEIEDALMVLAPRTILVAHCVVLRVIFQLLTDIEQELAAHLDIPHRSVWWWDSAKLHRQDQK